MYTIIRLIITSLFALALTSCSPAPSHPLRVAAHPWPGYELFYLARSLGHYDKSAIRLIETTSASETSIALRNGTIEAGTLTLDETLNLLQDGVGLHVILVIDASNGADALIAKDKINNLQSLRGKRIGVEVGAVGAIMLDAALLEGNLSPTDITIIPLNGDEHVAAWNQDKIDALVTYEPFKSQLVENGAQILFDSSRIPARILDVLVVTDDALEQHHDQLKQLLDGYFSALNYLREKPEDAVRKMAPRLASTPASVSAQFELLMLMSVKENARLLSSKPSPHLNIMADDLAKLMLQRNLLHREANVSNLADARFLPQVTP